VAHLLLVQALMGMTCIAPAAAAGESIKEITRLLKMVL